MTEAQHRLAEIVLKVVAMVGSLIAGIVAYKNFMAEYNLRTRQPLVELATEYHLEVVETASKIAFPESAEEQRRSVVRFHQLRAGGSSLVENSPLEVAVDDFSQCLTLTTAKCDQHDLEAKSMILSARARAEFHRMWSVDDAYEDSVEQEKAG